IAVATSINRPTIDLLDRDRSRQSLTGPVESRTREQSSRFDEGVRCQVCVLYCEHAHRSFGMRATKQCQVGCGCAAASVGTPVSMECVQQRQHWLPSYQLCGSQVGTTIEYLRWDTVGTTAPVPQKSL